MKNACSGNIENLSHELIQYKEFTNKENLIVVCEKCHKKIHYTDDPDLSLYRWTKERATTIENIE